MAIHFCVATKIISGKNCLEQNADLFREYGSRCMIVTGKTGARKSGALDAVTAVLEKQGIGYVHFDGIEQNPTLLSCQEAGRIAAAEHVEFILGVGGGSALDAAKAVAVTAVNPLLDEAGFYGRVWENRPLPILLVGTTSGTGSEVTLISVLTDSAHRKHSIRDERIGAAVSFGDPAFTCSMSRKVTVSTAVDAMAHCVEAFFNKKANPVTDAAAFAGAKILTRAFLEPAQFDGEIPFELREKLYDASIFGGLAISETGTIFPHNVGYYLTEQYHVPHGLACAVFMPDLFRHASQAAPERVKLLEAELGLGSADIVESAQALIWPYLEEYDVRMTPEEIDRILPRWDRVKNGSVNNTVGAVEMEQIREILFSKFVR